MPTREGRVLGDGRCQQDQPHNVLGVWTSSQQPSSATPAISPGSPPPIGSPPTPAEHPSSGPPANPKRPTPPALATREPHHQQHNPRRRRPTPAPSQSRPQLGRKLTEGHTPLRSTPRPQAPAQERHLRHLVVTPPATSTPRAVGGLTGKRGKQIDDVAVGVENGGVALTPRRVVGVQ
jgi:hypothetical protein